MKVTAKRHFIYLFVLLALSVPLIFNYSLTPARMPAAEKLYETIESIDPTKGGIAFVAFDFGPSQKAENGTQGYVMLEHLMRRRIPVALFSYYYQAEPFLTSIPEEIVKKLEAEYPGEKWRYGHDWVNLGYRPGAGMLIQSIPKSKNLAELFGKDARGNNLTHIPLFNNVRTIRDIKLLVEVTGLVGVLDVYIQFFQAGSYQPKFVHGATSITVPATFIYLDSGQLNGLLEGIAGAAWYSELLNRHYPKRVGDSSLAVNTALGIAHLVVIFLIVLGNIVALIAYLRGRK